MKPENNLLLTKEESPKGEVVWLDSAKRCHCSANQTTLSRFPSGHPSSPEEGIIATGFLI